MASKKILCPYCFNEFDNTAALYQCESDERNRDGSYRCDRVISEEYNQHWGVDTPIRYWWPQKSGFMSRLFGPKLKEEKCPQCGYPSQRFVCPHCYNRIPEDMVKNGAKIISVIGSPSSGKTNYIVSLIHELGEYGYQMDLMVHPSQDYRDGYKEESTQSRYIDFSNRLFKDKQVLNKTAVDNKDIPWIFHLNQQHTDQHIYLVFYDTAGEHFQENIKNNAKYLKESSAVIILLDTLAIEHVSEILKAEGLDGLGGKVQGDIEDISNAIVNSGIEDVIYSKPAAFVMSKFDAVLDHSDKLEINVDEFKRGGRRINSSYIDSGTLDLEKIDAISATIEKTLGGPWKEGKLRNYAHNWTSKKNKPLMPGQRDLYDPDNNYKFFGVSALGGMPDEAAQLKKVDPYRVMDPLIWVLYKLGEFDIPVKK